MSDDNIIYIENYIPHHPFEAMCMKCHGRWIAVVPEEMILKTLDCAYDCGPGYVIDTGQYIRSLEREDTTPKDGIPRDYPNSRVGPPEPGDAA